MAKKGVGEKVRMESTAGTGFRYYTRKTRGATEKMAMRKFDPWATHPETGNRGCHVEFKEKKMPPHKK